MITYWVLGRKFADAHDRAIRFIDPPNAPKQAEQNVPTDAKVQPEWCDKCSAWHLIRKSTLPLTIK